MNKQLLPGEALVYRSTGSWYVLKDHEGRIFDARVKGKLKIDEEISSTNPIAIGDRVKYAMEPGSEQAVISEVLRRDNYIVRVSPHNKHQKHIVAANLDLAIVIATIDMPRTSNGFVDRFLLTAEAYHIPALIVVNKTDVLRKERQLKRLRDWQDIYGAAGYEMITMSALEPGADAPLKERLQGRTSLFCGHSGVGKTTLINGILPGRELKTQEVSDWSGKGQHTTTFAEMFDLPSGDGRIVDTPGVKEFGLIDFAPEELSQYFPEMKKLLPECRFNNCLHLHEPGCAVKAAVAAQELSHERYSSYLSILATI